MPCGQAVLLTGRLSEAPTLLLPQQTKLSTKLSQRAVFVVLFFVVCQSFLKKQVHYVQSQLQLSDY
jgi:hypothetical protein